jgi:hypothetical protein
MQLIFCYVLLSVRSPCVLLCLCTSAGCLRTVSVAPLVCVPRTLVRCHNHARAPVPFISEVNVTGDEESMSNLIKIHLLCFLVASSLEFSLG